MATIDRPKNEADWEAMREICCRTADGAGGPIETTRWPFFGRRWIDPYRRWASEWSYVARDGEKVVGYLTGCADSELFALQTALTSNLVLAARALRGPATPDTRRYLRRLAGLERDPNEAFAAEHRSRYPAHLHVNVLAGSRGGVGRALVERFCDDAGRAGARGVHVLCAQRPVGFYLKLGFSELERLECNGAPLFCLGRPLR